MTGAGGDYRAFSTGLETLAALVRDLYRDVAENITGAHPLVYRQVHAGAELGVIAAARPWPGPSAYRERLGDVPFVTRVVMYPPVVLDPPTNTRAGMFGEVGADPLAGVRLEADRWLCYPAAGRPPAGLRLRRAAFHRPGPLRLANLFELAGDERVAAGPDAVLVFGAPPDALAALGERPTVFYDDAANDLLVGGLPLDDRFAYFGYLKKMILTLHNMAAMKRGLMPFHGAYTRLVLQGGAAAGVLLIGDTATGKSETLEALRLASGGSVAELRIVADDMGALEVVEHGGRPRVVGYGTEIGAFVRLDDLQQGYAIGQIDRAIIMSPQKVNARVVLPVTTLDEVQRGRPVDVLLYANNYEPVDDGHPLIERRRRGRGPRGLPRGPRPFKGHDRRERPRRQLLRQRLRPGPAAGAARVLAERTFAAAFAGGAFVGQLRTRLALPGFAAEGPRAAAAALLELIATVTKGEART